VADNQIIRDGYDIKDLETALSVDNLQKFMATDEKDWLILFGWLVILANGGIPEVPIPKNSPIIETEIKSAEIPKEMIFEPKIKVKKNVKATGKKKTKK
jgi:hypothetical protein